MCLCVYPVSRADGLVGGPWAGAEVKLLDGETLVVEADVVRAAGRPVLHVTKVRVPVDQHVSPTEKPRRSTSWSLHLQVRTETRNRSYQKVLSSPRGRSPAVEGSAVSGH